MANVFFTKIGEGFAVLSDKIGGFFLYLYGTIFSSGGDNSFFLSLLAIVITIGTVNWTIWIIRKTRSLFYVPFTGEYKATTSVVVPVYKEKTHILKETIDSILENNPNELILILDYAETKNMDMIYNNYKNNNKVRAFFIKTPGKRPALTEGIKKARGEIVVLVDSDTQWISKDFLKELIIPFRYENVGGVGSRQKTRENLTITHTLINWLLDSKYTDYVSSDSLSGSILCLSGRTAAYRRHILLSVLDRLENDYFLGHKNMGGDDARLTTLVLEQGYKTVYQDTAVAQSDFSPYLSFYMKQKVRWSRNSFRTYLKSFVSKWPYKQRRAYYLMSAYHTIVPGLSLLLSLALMLYSVYLGVYIFTAIWFAWAFVSRGIKSSSHLVKKPNEIVLLPLIVVYFYVLSFVKLYAFLTMTRERWAGSRKEYRIVNGLRVVQIEKEFQRNKMKVPLEIPARRRIGAFFGF